MMAQYIINRVKHRPHGQNQGARGKCISYNGKSFY
ncbi:hypothetical protein LA635_1803 [Erwinia amylovora LA635]|nr:hypothetical protein LA635_1803 [Erwinia amylovora LA635]CDK18794.1 hypothetical protein LA636_1802 [Erwinia amylovora LA636]CDK22164.1 hypothetical protein LA637_1804 [Erwinia amylovora LA637]